MTRPLRLSRRSAVAAVFASAALALSLVAVIPPAARAGQAEVVATDDAAGEGTCPASNSFGFPTGGNCFAPDVITVTVGDTVTWKSVGKRPHDVVADDEAFHSPYLYPGDSWSWTFDREGEVPYYCSLHGDRGGVGHAGKVIVVAAGAPAPEPVAPAPGGSGGGPAPGSEPGRATAPGPSGAGSAPRPATAISVPTSIGTELAVKIRAVAAPEGDAAPDPARSGSSPFVGGVVIGVLVLLGWRFATGGHDR